MVGTRERLEDQAAAFLQKRDGGAWSEGDQAELTGWLAASVAHRVTFLRIEAAWEEMGRLKALGAGLPRRHVPTSEELNAAHFRHDPRVPAQGPIAEPSGSSAKRRGLVVGYSIAASLLLALAALASYQLWLSGDRYSTPIGGITSVPLQDGSQITLNTQSRVRVALSRNERHIDLARGEAFFEVARDPQRPFIVQAGNKRVIAVGTKFSVRLEGHTVRVVVTEGRVRVEDPDAPQAPTSLAFAGHVAQIDSSGISIRTAPLAQAEDALSWRSGYVVFHETPLAQAVAELNRYSKRQIRIGDPELATMKLSGKFRATNSETFISLLQQTFHVRARGTTDDIVLTGAGAP